MYVTDQTVASLDALAQKLTGGNRTEIARQCLNIGIAHFTNQLMTKVLLEIPRDAIELDFDNQV